MAGGKFHVFAGKKGTDVGRRHLSGSHFFRIEPDAHRGSFFAAEINSPHAGQNLQAVFDLPFRKVREFEGRAGGTGEGDPHDFLGVRVLLGDDGFLDVVRKFVPDAADAVADILGPDIHITVQIEFHCDAADLFAGFAAENFNSWDVINLLFHRLGDIRFHEFGIRPGVDRDDRDHGRINIGKFAYGKSGKGDDADHGKG